MRRYKDTDADVARLNGRTVAVIGYGNQGRAQGLNLRDSAVQTVAGVRAGSLSGARALDDGIPVFSVADATRVADIIVMLTRRVMGLH